MDNKINKNNKNFEEKGNKSNIKLIKTQLRHNAEAYKENIRFR